MSTEHLTNPSEYLRGRTDLIALDEPVGQLLEHLAVSEIERRTDRALDLDSRLKLRRDLAAGLRQIARRERNQTRLALPARVTTGHLGQARIVGPPPDTPQVIPRDETGALALAAVSYEEAEHDLRASIAAEQWS